MTIEEANQHIEEHLRAVKSVLPRTARYEVQFHKKSMDCGRTETGSRSHGRVFASLEYQVLDLQPHRVPEYFSTIRKWWMTHGYRVLKDTPKNEYLWVENKEDGVRLSMQANDSGEIYIGADSPCVWPNGTPEPEG